MTITQPLALQAVPGSTADTVVRMPEQGVLQAQAKARKKERKHERLRAVFAWCAGCRCMGGSF